MEHNKIAIIGAGAAGCFAAAELARTAPQAEVHVFERLSRPLAKLLLTGGGRCNLTNSFAGVRSLEAVYPRGHRLMRRLFHRFDHRAAMAWFEREGVALVVQEDQCVFPRSQQARQVADTLLSLMRRHGVRLHLGHRLEDICPAEAGYQLTFAEQPAPLHFDAVVVTTGGSPRASGLDFLGSLGVERVAPVPSLFSVVVSDAELRALSGTVVEEATVRLSGTKLKAEGALLVTHLGLSGPAMLRLSAHAARYLAERDYRAEVAVNWLGALNEEETLSLLSDLARENAGKQLANVWPSALNRRLWLYLLQSLSLRPTERWSSLSPKTLRRLAARLTNHALPVEGRNPFKEEFVTCGGVALSEINAETLEHKRHPALFFAGEVLDVDAVTGGFNLQAAWTMGAVVAQALGRGV